MPPLGVTIAVPSFPPKQLTLVEVGVGAVNALLGSVIFTDEVIKEHPLASVTVQV